MMRQALVRSKATDFHSAQCNIQCNAMGLDGIGLGLERSLNASLLRVCTALNANKPMQKHM